jgi:hypothetical protein
VGERSGNSLADRAERPFSPCHSFAGAGAVRGVDPKNDLSSRRCLGGLRQEVTSWLTDVRSNAKDSRDDARRRGGMLRRREITVTKTSLGGLTKSSNGADGSTVGIWKTGYKRNGNDARRELSLQMAHGAECSDGGLAK